MINYGTIGTSWITEAFIQGSQMVNGLKLTAVHSRNYDKGKAFAEKYNANHIFTDYEEMAKSPFIDAVYIASPNFLHYEQSKCFLQNGKHVICEKPITINPCKLEELQKLANEKNLIYMEAIMMLHLPQRKILKEALKKIGNIFSARFDFSQLSSKYQALINGENPNIFNPEYATGCLMDLGIYCVYPALDLFGEPEKIINTAQFISTGADGLNNAIFIYPDKQINISCSKLCESSLGSEIMGDSGTIKIRSISKLTEIKIIKNDKTEEFLVGDIEKAVLMSGEAKSFYNYITDFESYKDEYFKCQKITLSVNKSLKVMREQAGIIFNIKEG